MNILIISTEQYLTLRLMKCLAGPDVTVHVISSGAAQAVRASRYCRHHTACKPSALVCAAVERYCLRHAIDVVLPSGMASVFLLASWKETFQAAPLLPTPSVMTLDVLNNKWRFSRLLQQQRLPFPLSCLWERAQEAETLNIPFPVIIKPLDLDASRGVARCDTMADVQTYLKQPGVVLPLLVQEYIPGEDVGLGLLSAQGKVLAWTIQKQKLDGSGVEFVEHEEVLEIGRRIMSLCQYDGIAHFDMRLDARDGSVRVLECNPRFWASLPFCMVAGINFADLAIRLAQGQALPETVYQRVSLTFPTKTLSQAWRGGLAEKRLSEPSLHALRVTLADPLPHVYLGAGKLQRKIRSFLAQTH